MDLPDAEIIYYPKFFDKEQSDSIYAELLQGIAWQQDNITIFGKTHPQPRLTALKQIFKDLKIRKQIIINCWIAKFTIRI